jgi:hypothetical protein
MSGFDILVWIILVASVVAEPIGIRRDWLADLEYF